MKRFLIILFIGLSCDLNVFSQDYVRFYDAYTNEPLSYTQVVKNNQIIAIADEDGYLAKSLIKCDGHYEVLISSYGYKKMRLNCDSLINSNRINLEQQTQYLETVNVEIKESISPLKKIKKQKPKEYFAKYYYKVKLYNEKYKLVYVSDMIVNIFDTGKNNSYPYKLEFVAKRESKLKVKDGQLDAIGDKIHVENELANLLWLNKIRNKKIFKDEKYNASVSNSDDTTFLFLKRKQDRVITNNALIKIHNDSVFYFDNKYTMKEELISNLREYYKDKKQSVFVITSKGYFYYINYSIYYSKQKNSKHIPISYSYVIKFELLEPTKSKIKYNMFYVEKSLELLQVLDLDLVKETTFNKENHLNYEPVGIIPTSHPYLDTIPLPKV